MILKWENKQGNMNNCKNRVKILNSVVRRFFEGEPTTADPVVPQQPVQQPPVQQPPVQQNDKATNDLINRKIAEEKRKFDDKNRSLAQQLTQLRESANLTEQEKANLQVKIDELESTYRTAEEQKKLELSKWEEKYNKETTSLKKEVTKWEDRHNHLLMSVDFNRASVKYKAYDPEQIEAILRPMTKVIEKEGKHVSQVKFPSKTKDGIVPLDLSVDDAVKAMHEWPEKYGNLFESTARGGVGSNTNGNGVNVGNRIPEINNMTTEQYKEYREKIREQMRKTSET